MKIKIVLTIFAIICSLFLCVDVLLSNGTIGAPPTGNTAAPGEGNCTSCHGGGTLNGFTGSVIVNVNGGATTYTPGGPAIPVTITITDAAQTRFGFEVTVLDAANNLVGNLSALVGSAVSMSGVRQYVYHSIGVTNATHTNTWTFNWTPPTTNVGPVTFYAIGNAGNNDQGSGGDHIYTSNNTITAASSTPVSSFTHQYPNGNNAFSICSGDTVVFTSTSTGTTASTFYAWDVDYASNGGASIIGGTGHQSQLPGPISAVYTNTGSTPVVYTTGLIISTSIIPTLGVNADSESHLIVVWPKAPSPVLSATQQVWSFCANEIDTITITNIVAGATYTMNFGSATLLGSAGVNGPFYIQLPSTQGLLPITCTASYPGSPCTSTGILTPPIYVQICNTTAQFYSPKIGPAYGSAIPASYCNGTSYYYTDSSFSVLPIVNFSWNFAVGSAPPYPSPQFATGAGPHAVSYPLGGNYMVREIITDAIGQTARDSHLVVVINCGVTPLTAAFNVPGPSLNHCLGKMDTLSDFSYGGSATINSWDWNWGDATPHDNTLTAYHNYANTGSYTVTFVVGNGVAFDTAYLTINVVGAPSVNVANNDTICPGFSVPVGGASVPGNSYSWYPSIGLSPSASASNPSASPAITTTYYLTVTEPIANCTATDSVLISVGSAAPLIISASNSNPCINATVNVTCTPANAGTYTWNFGGGLIVSGSGGGPYQISWPTSTIASVNATVVDNFGCTSSSNNLAVSIQNCAAPIANFQLPNNIVCTSVAFQLLDASVNGPTSWSWNFGPGAIPGASIAQNPTVSYNTAGPHIITLIVANGGGANSYSDTINVVQTPTAIFQTITPSCVGVSTLINYNGSASPAANYVWNFNGGIATPSTGPGPISCFWVSSGTQPVSLTVDENGCTSAIAINNVIINNNPVSNFNFTLNSGLLVSFQNASSGASSYTWSGADGLNSTLTNPIHTYSAPGNYQVCLLATNGNCSSQKCDTIAVDYPSGIALSMNAPIINVLYLAENQLLLIDQIGVKDEHATVSVFNSAGQLVQTTVIAEKKSIVQLATITDGWYMVQVKNAENTVNKKIIITHQ